MARAREAVRRALRTSAARLPELFAPGTRLLVAFSGGQDSTCLLHALAHAHRTLDLVAAHVDHSLRADSAEAAVRVSRLADQLGVGCHTVRVDVPGYRRALPGWSVQQAARAARYRALAAVAEQHTAAALLVAHTADDQAETLLLHLLRGAGLAGLAGMRLDATIDVRQLGPPLPAVEAGGPTLRVVRPLLRVGRATTLAYCNEVVGLPLVEDASNLGRGFTRNRVRLDLLPVLEQFNPAIRSVLARTADLAAEDGAALDGIVAELHERINQNGEYELRLWRAQPRALQRRLLRLALGASSGAFTDVTDASIEDALDLLQTGQPNQTYHLPYGVELCIGAQRFRLRENGHARRPTRRSKLQKSWEVEFSRV